MTYPHPFKRDRLGDDLVVVGVVRLGGQLEEELGHLASSLTTT